MSHPVRQAVSVIWRNAQASQDCGRPAGTAWQRVRAVPARIPGEGGRRQRLESARRDAVIISVAHEFYIEYNLLPHEEKS